MKLIYSEPLGNLTMLITEQSQKARFLYVGFGDVHHVERAGAKIQADKLLSWLSYLNRKGEL